MVLFFLKLSFFEFSFKLSVSSSSYFCEYSNFILNIKENMSFSWSNARERPPPRAASGKHGCMLAQSPTRLRHTPHQPQVELLPSLLSGAPHVCRGPLRVRRARSVAPRKPHAQGLTSRTHRARVSDVALLCFHPCVGLNARVRAVLLPARDARTGTNALFTMCTHRLATSMKHRSIIGEPCQAHASHKAARIESSYVCDGFVFVVLFACRFET